MPLPGEDTRGGHAMCMVGYQDDAAAPGGGFFIVRNSWGEGWAYACDYGAGHALIPYDYIHTQLKGTNEKKKEARISNIVGPNCERGILRFPRPEHHPHVKVFIDHEYIPFGSKGSDMDMLDSLTLAIHHLVGEARITSVPWFFPD